MRVKDVIRAPKDYIRWGNWRSGKMPRSEFPLSRAKRRHYSLGSCRWRICQFSISGNSFRLWVLYRADKEQYKAILGRDLGGDMLVLARLEFHGTHPGWHVHTACGNEIGVDAGRLNTPLHWRAPRKGGGYHRRDYFGVAGDHADDLATDIAIKGFNIRGPGALL